MIAQILRFQSGGIGVTVPKPPISTDAQSFVGRHVCQHYDSIAIFFYIHRERAFLFGVHSYRLFNGSKHHCHECDRRWLDMDSRCEVERAERRLRNLACICDFADQRCYCDGNSIAECSFFNYSEELRRSEHFGHKWVRCDWCNRQ